MTFALQLQDDAAFDGQGLGWASQTCDVWQTGCNILEAHTTVARMHLSMRQDFMGHSFLRHQHHHFADKSWH